MNSKLYTATQIDSRNEPQHVETIHNDVDMNKYIAKMADRMDEENE